jgi:hypothetical protein
MERYSNISFIKTASNQKFPGSQLAEHLAQISQMTRKMGNFDLQFSSLEDLLISERSSSQLFDKHQPDPQYQSILEGMRANPSLCEARACFRNAALAALTFKDEGVQYCEGFALPGFIPLPIHHAWNLLPDDTVVDCTWCGGDSPPSEMGSEYIGIVVPYYIVDGFVGSSQGAGAFHYPEIREILTNPPEWALS